MPVVVKRFGGFMPTKPKERTFSLSELDETARKALDGLLHGAPKDERMPDAYTYTFEVSGEGGAPAQASVSGTNVPEALRKLLP